MATIIIIIALATAFAVAVYYISKKTEATALRQEEPEQTPQEESTPVPAQPTHQTRKHNFRYYFMSEAGNVYPRSAKGYFCPGDTFEFTIAGTNYNDHIADYLGEFRGRLVPDPTNEHDPNAIRVEHEDGGFVGYVPRKEQQELREFKGELPCPCYCFVEFKAGDDFYFLGHCYVVSEAFGEL